jgi:hypothetical protein
MADKFWIKITQRIKDNDVTQQDHGSTFVLGARSILRSGPLHIFSIRGGCAIENSDVRRIAVVR